MGGVVIFLLHATGAAASVAAHGLSGATAMLAGCLTLLTGIVVTLAGIETTSAVVFLAGTTVVGAGFGADVLGAFRTVSGLAPPGQRASLVAAAYVAVSVPVVAAGVAVTHFGLDRTAVGYATAIGVLTAVAAGSLIFRRRLHGATPDPALMQVDAAIGTDDGAEQPARKTFAIGFQTGLAMNWLPAGPTCCTTN